MYIVPGEMREHTEEIQMYHKEEAPSRIRTDGQDRLFLRQKLAICINPINHEEHPPEILINIVTGEVIINKEVSVDKAYELGKTQQKELEAAWSESFYKPLKRVAVPKTANRKAINVGGQKIVDTGVFYARALGLHSSHCDGSPSIESMLETEVSPIATSMFDDQGHMRTTKKAH